MNFLSSLEPKDLIVLLGVLTGLVGSLSALAASLIAYFNYRRDGAIIKVGVKKDVTLINPGPGYSEDKIYINLTVSNRGRRHANITKAGEVYLFKSGGGIYSDSMIYGSRKLEEDTSTDYLVEEKPGEKRPVTGYYYATSGSGREYRYYPYTRFVFWLYWPSRKLDLLVYRLHNKKAAESRKK